jgi:hypothetical protein
MRRQQTVETAEIAEDPQFRRRTVAAVDLPPERIKETAERLPGHVRRTP